MKHLFLIRHGKSSWSDPALEDWERPLNNRGKRQMEIMAAPLAQQGAFNGQIYSSNAMRARKTLEGMIATLGDDGLPARTHFKSKLYTFDSDVLRKWLTKRQEDSITLVGHNPALLELANSLLRKPIDELPTGSCIHLMLPIQQWDEVEDGTAALGGLLLPRWIDYTLFQKKQPPDPGKKEAKHPLQALSLSLPHIMERLQKLEPGAKLGYDIEFLHQYRVAIRRARAVLETVYQITGDNNLKKPVKRFKRNAQATSQLRDLDVFLDTLAEWNEDSEFRDALRSSGALEAFGKERETAQKAFAEHVMSRQYMDDMDDLREFIHAGELNTVLQQLDKHRIREALDARIADHNARLVALSDLSSDDDFHRLRKNLKRTRYLADLDPALPSDFRKDLKKRQKLLGEFQDRHVQQDFMLKYQAGADPEGTLSPLIQRLDSQKQAARQHILTLDPIDTPEPVARAVSKKQDQPETS
ncbi:CHAD domain-containing protein [Marinobacter fonticola]|uniref:CHAD domain-containing protein n=1 Tax=Marinobacter fonticola TaxID=2603215 RepID=UPI0011E750EA|nr:CHAD domain-containing protein [Marinobacter fonticola]